MTTNSTEPAIRNIVVLPLVNTQPNLDHHQNHWLTIRFQNQQTSWTQDYFPSFDSFNSNGSVQSRQPYDTNYIWKINHNIPFQENQLEITPLRATRIKEQNIDDLVPENHQHTSLFRALKKAWSRLEPNEHSFYSKSAV